MAAAAEVTVKIDGQECPTRIDYCRNCNRFTRHVLYRERLLCLRPDPKRPDGICGQVGRKE